MKVLVVDDSRSMRQVYAAVLDQLGHCEVGEACDGLDALSRVEVFEPDLILVDWTMPNMNGLTFVRQYRARGGMARVIMVGASSEKGRIVDSLGAGANTYVVKPFTPDVLVQRIEETIARVEP